VNADKVEQLIVGARVDDHPSVGRVPHIDGTKVLGYAVGLGILERLLTGDKEAESILARAGWLNVLRELGASDGVDTIGTDQDITLDNIAVLQSDGRVVRVNIDDFAGSVEDCWLSLARRLSGSLETFVEVCAVNK
jgi:hypothetical protein